METAQASQNFVWIALFLGVFLFELAVAVGLRRFRREHPDLLPQGRGGAAWLAAYIRHSLDEFTQPALFPEASRLRIPAAFALTAGMGLIAAGQALLPILDSSISWPYILLAAGGCAFLAGLVLLRPRFIGDILQQFAPAGDARERLTGLRWFALLLAGIFAGITWTENSQGGRLAQPLLILLLWLLSIACGLLAFYHPQRPAPGSRGLPGWLPAAALLILLAGLVRLVSPERYPPLLINDEGAGGLDAAAFANGAVNNPFVVGWFSFPSMFFALQSVGVLIFGQTIPALRLAPALAGIATVGLLYWAGSQMIDRRVGLCAALILAVYHLHVHFSRVGLNNIFDAFFFTWTFAFLVHARRTGSRFSYALAGLGLGLAQYFYATSKVLLFTAPLLLLWLGRAANPRGTPGKRGVAAQAEYAWLPFVITAALAAAPLASFYRHAPETLTAPFTRASMVNALQLSKTISHPVSITTAVVSKALDGLRQVSQTPVHGWYNSTTPMLMFVPAVFFFCGLLLTLAQWRQGWARALILWILPAPLMIGLSTGDAVQRLVAMFPALALLVGLGMVACLDLAAIFLPRFRLPLLVLFVGLIALTGYGEARNYFLLYPQRKNFDDSNWLSQGLAEHLRLKPAGTQVVMFARIAEGYESMSSLPYLTPHVQVDDRFDLWTGKETPPRQSEHLVFIFREGKQDLIPEIQERYPGGSFWVVQGTYGAALAWIYDLGP